MKKYVAGNFTLEVEKGEVKLLYNEVEFLNNCESILQLILDLGLGDTSTIDRFDLSEDQIDYLEKMLVEKIYTEKICLYQK